MEDRETREKERETCLLVSVASREEENAGGNDGRMSEWRKTTDGHGPEDREGQGHATRPHNSDPRGPRQETAWLAQSSRMDLTRWKGRGP